MEQPIQDEKRENVIREYRIVDEENKHLLYIDSYSANILNNELDFHYGYDLYDELRSDEVI